MTHGWPLRSLKVFPLPFVCTVVFPARGIRDCGSTSSWDGRGRCSRHDRFTGYFLEPSWSSRWSQV